MEATVELERATVAPETLVPYSLGQLVRYFLGLGSFGFGGPIALAGYMQRDLVEVRRWIAKSDYVQGVALAPSTWAILWGCGLERSSSHVEERRVGTATPTIVSRLTSPASSSSVQSRAPDGCIGNTM